MKKYELTEEFVKFDNRTLYRIKALIDIGDRVKKGDLGGFIENEGNLSHEGNCWVYGDAMVCGDAKVQGNADVYSNAKVFDSAWIHGNAEISGNARVYGYAEISGNARVYGYAEISGNARVYGNARVSYNARVSKLKDLIWFSHVGYKSGTLTVFKATDGLSATIGCFSGSVDDFLKRSAEVHDEKTKREYQLLIEVAKSRLGD